MILTESNIMLTLTAYRYNVDSPVRIPRCANLPAPPPSQPSIPLQTTAFFVGEGVWVQLSLKLVYQLAETSSKLEVKGSIAPVILIISCLVN